MKYEVFINMSVNICVNKKVFIVLIVVFVICFATYSVYDRTFLDIDYLKQAAESSQITFLTGMRHIMKKVSNKSEPVNSEVIIENQSDEVPLLIDMYESGFVHSLSNLCPDNGTSIQLLIVITSAPDHSKHRMAIRSTWGHFDHRSDVVIAFLVGITQDNEVTKSIAEENKLFNDVIVTKNIDAYKNLTLKTMAMCEWITNFCPNASFVLKTDDDMFVNVPRLLDFTNVKSESRKTIYGRLAVGWKPIRSKLSKYYLSGKDFTGKIFPDFTTGPAYMMTSDVPTMLYETALTFPFLFLEDVFFTGIVAQSLGIKRVSVTDFTNMGFPKKKNPCVVHTLITAHDVDVHAQFQSWTNLMDKPSNC